MGAQVLEGDARYLHVLVVAHDDGHAGLPVAHVEDNLALADEVDVLAPVIALPRTLLVVVLEADQLEQRRVRREVWARVLRLLNHHARLEDDGHVRGDLDAGGKVVRALLERERAAAALLEFHHVAFEQPEMLALLCVARPVAGLGVRAYGGRGFLGGEGGAFGLHGVIGRIADRRRLVGVRIGIGRRRLHQGERQRRRHAKSPREDERDRPP